MAKLDELLFEIQNEIPGARTISVVGMDGLDLAIHSTDNLDTELANAQFAMIMKLVKKTAGQLGDDSVQDNLVTTKDSYIITRFIGDGSYFVAIFVDRENGNLGNVRLVTRQYSDAIWQAIPKRKTKSK